MRNRLSNILSPIRPIPPGIYHYISPENDPRNYRLHLRIELDGSGILIINASTVLHLNQTASEYAYYLVKNFDIKKASKRMSSRYQVDSDTAANDYINFIEKIQLLINTPDLDPITFFDFDRRRPFSGEISAPYRLDCALTYRTPAGDENEVAPIDRVCRELSIDEWKTILDKAWGQGIPHIIFTGGEPTLREDLCDLISYAEKNDQITGLITDGHLLIDKAYINKLLQTGLDHITLIWQTNDESSQVVLENLLPEDIFVGVHLTLTHDNHLEIPAKIKQLATLGVKTISLSTNNEDLKTELLQAHQNLSDHDIELIWNLPVPYSELNPVKLELVNPANEGAGRAWFYVEPDGDVLPEQGNNTVLGNLLNDPWEMIWKNPER